jgi:diadenosine tetraphosphate (Ap4A) HIT family hydrolase
MSREFLDDVNKRLEIDAIAIVLDVEEDGEFMINSYLEPFHGVIARRDTADEFDKYDQEQWKEMKDEIAKEEEQLKQAREEDKAAIKAKIAKLKSERDEKIKKITERNANAKQHLQNKLKALDEKWKASNQQIKARIEEHREKLQGKLIKMNEEIKNK